MELQSLMRGGVIRGEILGIERRRRWEDDEKLAIVSAVGVGGATVTHVAQRHEVTWQQIYAWCHELKRKGLWRNLIEIFLGTLKEYRVIAVRCCKIDTSYGAFLAIAATIMRLK